MNARNELMALYQSQFSALLVHLQRLIGDRAHAQDLAQQAGMKLLEMSDEQVGALREPRAFLFQVATNLARDALRRRVTATAGNDELLQRQADRVQPDPETLACVQQELQRVQTAIADLPAQARSVLLLSRVHGRSHKEIARELGIQPKTVENYLARALAGLAQRLKGSLP